MTVLLNKLERDLVRAGLWNDGEQLTLLRLIPRLPLSRMIRITCLIRIASKNNGFFVRVVRSILWSRYSIHVSAGIRIGPGLLLPHASGVVINGDIGSNVTIGQYVTIGGNFKKVREIEGRSRKTPIIGDNVWLGAGSVVAGPLIIGSHVIVGANSVITHDVPSNSMAMGRNEVSSKRIFVNLNGSYQVLSDS